MKRLSMSDEIQANAEVTSQKQLSAIWIIPILALAMGLWMLFQYVNSTGPKITLILPTADGLEVGKTQIKALNVNVGVITDITLSENYDHIVATAQMSKDAERMLREDSLLWVVKPRIGREGISGLDTLLSGAYIQLQPGQSTAFQDQFTVMDLPPIAPPDAKGLRLILTSKEAGKLSVGDPVMYEGFTVGRVETTQFDVESKKAHYQLFIFSPYDKLVSTRSFFWLNSGINLQLNAEGLEFSLGSVESLLKGGVTFGLLQEEDAGQPITQQMTEFRLFDDVKQIREGMYDDYIEFVMMFDESVRGLKPSAPVEYRGLRIGTVSKVPLRTRTSNIDISTNRIPVLVRIELGRLYDNFNKADLPNLKSSMQQEFFKGLKASLKTGNLVTGALYIDTDYYPEEKIDGLRHFEGYPLFPTKQGGFAEVQKQVTDLLRKLNGLPMGDTLDSLNNTLKTSEKLLASAERILKKQETQNLPADIKASLKQLEATLGGFGPESTVYHELETTLKELNQVMAEFKPVLRTINEKPNALIFGDSDATDPIPAKGKQ
ncbi:paraquat-inducible protein B [Vibrio metoecus]|nr:paraquat-inducible protein B [Vibrio metoecus]PAR33545.1 paraquat-inducible protein B [Vibrio metoecus]PAR36901.1 paraquat-inducible protein B [Vibrio metoecus]PAR44390.1 paraquat-inducible protein B [Vibrio metoecus]PAR56738.1 paraquat-inducible protein B [Vibrio metoecus]